jgi:hypothetical protein
MVDPTVEDTYWREAHTKEPYYSDSLAYDDDYAPAYRAGYEGRVKYDGRAFDEVESDLQSDYARYRGNDMNWEEVRPATRAAWDRIDTRVQSATGN